MNIGWTTVRYQKILSIVLILMLYIAGYELTISIVNSLLILLVAGGLMLSNIGDLLKEQDDIRLKKREEEIEKEEREYGYHSR